MSLPRQTNILIIGGGPAGAYSGAALAREGFDVTILEASKFPRYHIGESLLPSVNNFFSFIGAEERLRTRGFCVKPGGAVKLSQHKKEGYADFIKYDPSNHAYNVERADFDEFLFRYAAECGAKVFEETKVTDVTLPKTSSVDQQFTPGCVRFAQPGDTTGEIQFDYLIDASGRAGILSTKYLKNRQMNDSLRNVAMWGYWTAQHKYGEGTTRENAPLFECLKDGTGWVWFIPLQPGKVSVGVVTEAKAHAKKKSDGSKDHGGKYSAKDHYLDQLKLAPDVLELLTGAVLHESADTPTVRLASDFSYTAETHAGDHYRIVGDASSFIDPLFSSGVHLALLGGLTAAISIAASIRKDCSEADAIAFHNKKVTNSYHRFLSVVTSAYAQLKRQGQDVLAAPEEKNFDRSINIFMPVIKGTSDTDFDRKNMNDLRHTMEFCHEINSNIYHSCAPNVYKACADKDRATILYQACTDLHMSPNAYQAYVANSKASDVYQTCAGRDSNVYQACVDKENISNIYHACAEKHPNHYQACAEKNSNVYQTCADMESRHNIYQACADKEDTSNVYHACAEQHSDIYQACADKDSNLYQACVDKEAPSNVYHACAERHSNVYQACVERDTASNVYQAYADKEGSPNLYHAYVGVDKAPNVYQACACVSKESASNVYQACAEKHSNVYQACATKERAPNLYQASVGKDSNVYDTYAEKHSNIYQACADKESASNVYHTCAEKHSNVYHACAEKHSNIYQACTDKESNVYHACAEKHSNLYQACADKDSNVYQVCANKDSNVYKACAGKGSNVYQACADKNPNVYQVCADTDSNVYKACADKNSNVYQACVDKDNSPNLYQSCVDEDVAPNLYQAASETEKIRSLYHAFEEDDKAQAFYQSLSQSDKVQLKAFFNSRTSGTTETQVDLGNNLSEAFAQASEDASGAEVYSGFESSIRTFYQAFARTAKPDLLRNLYSAFSSSVKSEYINNLYQIATQATPGSGKEDAVPTGSNVYQGVANEKPEDGALPFGPHDLLNDHVNGLVPRLEKGKLGLVCA